MGTCGAAEIVTQRGDGRSYVIPNDFRGENEIQTSQCSAVATAAQWFSGLLKLFTIKLVSKLTQNLFTQDQNQP